MAKRNWTKLPDAADGHYVLDGIGAVVSSAYSKGETNSGWRGAVTLGEFEFQAAYLFGDERNAVDHAKDFVISLLDKESDRLITHDDVELAVNGVPV